MIVCVIGGGASGMAAALAAAENQNIQVYLLERQSRLGRKLQATGNGRCNLSNMGANGNSYHGEDPTFALPALEEFNPQQTLSWFRRLGLFTVMEDSGKVYPYSDQANSVVDILRFALEKENITVCTDFEVKKITKTQDGFSVSNGEKTIECQKLIVACGGIAGSKLGGTMSGYKLLGKFGHKSTRLRPALVQLKTDWAGISGLKGVRANCHAQILHNGVLHRESTGEIQFTDYGISGPVIFEVSRDACIAPGRWSCVLDLMPQCGEDDLLEELHRRKARNLELSELLTGILHNRLGRLLVKTAGIRQNGGAEILSEEDLREVCRVIKSFELPLTEPMGMENAQVTAGGILTEQFDSHTLESKLVPGLYACGEVLDIDGDCGGYNLQWAWSSGRLAGLSAGKESL